MNRTLKDATVRRYHYQTKRQLEDHLGAFLDGYNFAKRLKTKPSVQLGQTSQTASGSIQPT